jgi:hypothetical protein
MPEPEGYCLVDEFPTNLVARVVDFQTHTTAVERALNHCATRVRPVMADAVDLIEGLHR